MWPWAGNEAGGRCGRGLGMRLGEMWAWAGNEAMLISWQWTGL